MIFRRISLTTLLAVYFLILVGGIVRSTGSGMGCPDWPKCFGAWIPPTSESELPDNYREIYVDYRQEKNERFAAYLDGLGFDKKAELLRNDTSILEETGFNSVKTWTEYINRLVGVIIGFLVIATFIASFRYLKKDRILFTGSLILLILVIFQGWIGSIVVSSNLVPWMVTVHMLIAVMIIGLLTFLVFRSRKDQLRIRKLGNIRLLNPMLGMSLVFILIQIIFGTQVRESIDEIASMLNYQNREMWIDALGIKFMIHRSFSILILVYHLIILVLLFRAKTITAGLLNFANILMGLLVLEVSVGAFMSYFNIPAFAQPVHLLLAVMVFGIQMLLFLVINNYESVKNKQVYAK